jgi:epoxyqueuosine reductase
MTSPTIKARNAAGFDLAASRRPIPAYTDVYARWLAAATTAPCTTWPRPRARADPRGCRRRAHMDQRGLRYSPPTARSADERRPARSRHARGADYHRVFDRRMHALADWIRAHAPQPCAVKVYCDTSAVLEREVAQRAGLGWIGKNTLLINPQQGSWLLLGELLTDLELAADAPMVTDHCGTCTRCIEACPTACILPERVLDATRCIAYLTIEQDGPIPDDLALDIVFDS